MAAGTLVEGRSMRKTLVRFNLQAVCFDYRGVLVDHESSNILPGMEELLTRLKETEITLALVTRFPLEDVQLGSLQTYFGENLCSSNDRTKMDCIKELAKKWGIGDLKVIAFVDDKPDNLTSVSQQSEIFVIGFRGSGKYVQARDVCQEQRIVFAENVVELEHLLLGDREHPS
jgi:hypothetical protein